MQRTRKKPTPATYDTFRNEKGTVIYRCRVEIRNPETGKTEPKTITARSRAALDARVALWTGENIDTIIPHSMKSPSVEKCVTVWLKTAEQTMSKETLHRYQISARNYIIPKFGKLRIKRVTPQVLQEYFDELSGSRSPRTLMMLRSHFSVFFDTIVGMGVIEKNPMKDTELPITVNRKSLKEDDLGRLIAVAESGEYMQNQADNDFGEFLRRRNYLIVRIGAATGLKKEDVIGLTWDCIQGNQIVLESKEKGYYKRTVGLPEDVSREIKEWRKFQKDFAKKERRRPYENTGNLLFTKLSGEGLTAHWFNRLVFRAMCVAAGLSSRTQYRYLHRKAAETENTTNG